MESIEYINFNDVKFNEFPLSTDSAYSLIWSGKYKNKKCAIKMVVLTTGNFYDKDNNSYVEDGIVIVNEPRCFKKDDKVPFLHTKFLKKRAMSKINFLKEIENQKKLEKMNLTPKIYGFFKSHKIKGIQYAFIVMELLDTSLRDLLKIRKISESEEIKIVELIMNMNIKYRIIHRDLKPANIGIKLSNNKIHKVYVLDCNFIEIINDDNDEYLEKVIKDINYFIHTQ